MRQLYLVVLSFIWLCSVTAHAKLPTLSYITEDTYPFNYKGPEGKPQGIAVELLKLIWLELGVDEQEIRVLPWARAYYLSTQKPDVVLFSAARTTEREKSFKWVCPIGQVRVIIMGKRAEPASIVNLEQLHGAKIGAMRADVGEQLLLNNNFDDNNILSSNNYRQLIRLLLSNRVDYISGVESIIQQSAIINQLSLEKYQEKWLLADNPLCYAFNPAISDQVVKQFQQALDAVIRSGAYQEIISHYPYN